MIVKSAIMLLVIMMRILVVSDIHGACEELTTLLEKERFDKLIILGDLFSYGYYQSKQTENDIEKLLIDNKSKLILIRGNCDVSAKVDALGIRTFDTVTLPLNGQLVTLTHGNRYKKGLLPPNHGNIFFFGHTHVPCLIKERNIIYANPGSLGVPRNGSISGYIIFNDDKITLKNISGQKISEMKL